MSGKPELVEPSSTWRSAGARLHGGPDVAPPPADPPSRSAGAYVGRAGRIGEVAKRARTSRSRRSPPLRDQLGERRVCGWWRHIRASMQTSPCRSATSKDGLDQLGFPLIGFSQSTCLPASSARIVHSTCQRVRQRDVRRPRPAGPRAARRSSRVPSGCRADGRRPPRARHRGGDGDDLDTSARRGARQDGALMSAVESSPKRS